MCIPVFKCATPHCSQCSPLHCSIFWEAGAWQGMWYTHSMPCSLAQVSMRLFWKWVLLSDTVPSGVPCHQKTCFSPPAHSLMGWGEGQKRPWLCVSPARQQQKLPCSINTVFSTNLKHSPILATMRKMNSLPVKISTDLNKSKTYKTVIASAYTIYCNCCVQVIHNNIYKKEQTQLC